MRVTIKLKSTQEETLVKKVLLLSAGKLLKKFEEMDKKQVESRLSCNILAELFKEELRKELPKISYDHLGYMKAIRREISDKWIASQEVQLRRSDTAYFVGAVHRKTGKPLAELRMDWIRFLVKKMEEVTNVDV